MGNVNARESISGTASSNMSSAEPEVNINVATAVRGEATISVYNVRGSWSSARLAIHGSGQDDIERVCFVWSVCADES